MTILQQPDALSFSMNLKPFKISTSEEVEFSLMQGGETLFSEMLSPDADGQIELSLRDIIHDRLSCQVPPTADPYVQSSVVADFTAVSGSTSVTFRVIRGGVDRLSGTVNDFLRANFLTWQPNVKPVTYSSPEFLSYYAVDSGCKLKVKAYFTDSAGNVTPGAVKTICSLAQGVVTTVSVQYAVIAGLYSGSLPAYYDVWVASGSTALTYTQRYYASTMQSEEEQWIFFENSLGGIDTFRTFGAVTLDAEHTHHIAEIDDVSYEYRVDTERKWTVNTGHLDISERRWLLDFFPSAGKYVYAGSAVRRIVLTDDSVSYRFRELPSSYSFTFRFAEALPLLNLPRHELPVEMLDITVPDIGSFTLPPRLLEFSRLPLSEGVLFPVQSPYAEEWQVVTMGGITQYLRSVLDIPSPGLGRTDIIRLLSAQLTPLDPLHPEESRIDPSWLPEGYGIIDIEHVTVTGLREELDSKLDTRFFSNVFTVYDGSGNAIVPNTYEQVADNLKIMVGAWTDQYLSALGLNSQGGGGETGGVSGIRVSSSSVLTPDDEGVVNMTGYIIQPAEKTRWDAAAAMRHGHSNKSILDSITSQQISSWNALTSVRILPGDGLAGGGDLSADVTLSVKLASNSGLSVSSGGLKLDAVNALNSTLTYKALSAAQGKALNDRLAILEAMFTREGSGTSADPYVIRANYGLYTDSFLSALGLNSQGGGGSTFDEAQMWIALGTDVGTKVIDSSHIPDTSSLYGYLKKHQTLYTLSIYGGTTKVLDFKPDANASIYIKAGGDISLANDTTNRYITLSYSHPTDGANTTISAANGRVLSAITVNSLGHVTSVSSKTLAAADIPDLSSTYATASRTTTLEGYFTSGSAKTALALKDSHTLWGQPFDGSANVTGTLSSVSGIQFSSNGYFGIDSFGNFNATTNTDSNFWNVYRYDGQPALVVTASSGNVGIGGTTSPAYKLHVVGTFFANGNSSIGGTLGVTGATTLTGLLTANGNIVTGTSNGAYIQIGAIKLVYDSTNNALKVIKSDNTSANFYATGAVSALGANSSGGGGGDFSEAQMWAALQSNTGTYANEKIDTNHIPDMAGIYGYLKQSALNNYVTSVKVGTTAYNPSSGVVSLPAYPTKLSQLANDSGYVTSSGVTSITLKAGAGISLDVDNTAITSTGTRTITNSGVRAATINGNYLRVNTNGTNADLTIPYATSAGSVAWGNVSGKPTTVNGYGITDAVFNISRQGDGILKYYVGSTANYLDFSHNHSYWDILDRPVDLEGFGLTSEMDASYAKVSGSNATGTWGISVSGNAATATKLATAITIWGRSFDGSANVSGALSGVSGISFTNRDSVEVDNCGNLKLNSGENKWWHVDTNAGTLVFAVNSSGNVGIGLSSPTYKLQVNGTFRASGDSSIGGTLGVTGATTLTGLLTANGNIATGTSNGAYIQIGAIKLVYDSTNNALKVIKSDNTSANLYATGAVSALGANSSGGGGSTFDEEQMWQALDATNEVINTSHIPDMAGIYGYLKQSALSGYITSVKVGTTAYNPSSGVVSLPAYPTKLSQLANDSGYVTSSGVTSITLKAGTGISLDVDNTAITSTGTRTITNSGVRAATINGNYLRVNTNGTNADLTIPYATSAGSVAWGNVSGKPTTVNGYGITDAVFNISRQGDGILKYYVGSTANYLDFSHNHSYWDILDRPVDLEGFGLTSEMDASYAKVSGSNATGTWGISVTGNASTATKLQTARTLWGQSFDGTANVSGNMTDVGSITPSANGNNLGTSSARFNIYGTGGNFSGALSVTGATTLTGLLTANGNIVTGTSDGAYIQIGAIKLVYDSVNNALKVIKSDNTSANFYATGAVSALGANSSGGGGGGMSLNEVWQSLANEVADNYSTTKIHTNHIPDMAGIYGYLKQSALNNYVTSVKVGTTTYNPSSGVVSLPAYPTSLPASDVYSWAKASTKPTYTLDEVSDGSTRKLANYLPLAGGTLTGGLAIKFDTDSSRALGYNWLNTSGTSVASIIYHNTAKNIILNPVGSSNPWNDEVGKYSLFIGNNKLTYNTYTILHSYNTYVSSGKGYINGTVITTISGNASTATKLKTARTIWGQSFDGTGNITGNITLTGNESNNIVSLYNDNGAITTNRFGNISSIRHALSFRWYGTSWQIGNIRGGSDDSEGFGVTKDNNTLVFSTSDTRTFIAGAVGIGTTSPSYKLHVAGNILASGEITASSDARKKNIISNTKFNVKDIASARSILYEWNDDRDKDNEKKIHGGSIAQDWLGKADSFLNQDSDGWYSINYGALALCSAITIAREVVKHEDRITMLEKENAKLKARIAELEERRVA